jgi:hypothetical protein
MRRAMPQHAVATKHLGSADAAHSIVTACHGARLDMSDAGVMLHRAEDADEHHDETRRSQQKTQAASSGG